MDLLCTRCAEPWDLDYVVHEAPADFTRDGSLLTECPACKGKPPPQLNNSQKLVTQYAGAIADLLGDDLDGAACEMQDLLEELELD